MGDVDAKVLMRASTQLGLVTRSQLLADGSSSHQIQRRLGMTLERVQPGVLRVVGWPQSHAQSCLAALLSVSRGGAPVGTFGISRLSAGALWGIALGERRVVDLCVPKGRGKRLQHVRLHQGGPLPPSWITSLGNGIDVTTVPVTLVHLAAMLEESELEDAVENALRMRLTTVDAVDAALEELGRRSVAGVVPLRRLLTGRGRSTPASESPAELAFERLLPAWGIPAPERQYELVVRGGRKVRLDFAWPQWRLGVEIDSYRFHGGRRDQRRDDERELSIKEAGWHLHHVQAAELYRSPEEAISLLLRFLVLHQALSPRLLDAG